ncbi:hypothetical protein SAMN02745824_0819 [Parasphingorhabdus marina DSM 22363]|uniref:Uncharacterized protein n=1 Tax=Parasphingorhabdus marina DSM 22363 TaxID=1123272 RepID=A0A1N6CRC8_9SPHN|nr:hypothetical protein [Parasphingorhabdus marina]SIN61138.1 hypothetical protein SAMN02745824_0819 [Parasphingorhabdus marina DSM 22363]
MNLSIAGWLIFAGGVLVAAGEFVLAMMFSGSTIAEGPVYQQGAPSETIIAVVRPEDRPVRIILDAEGVRRGVTHGSADRAVPMTLHFGDGLPPVEHIFRPRAKANSSQANYFHTYFPVKLNDRPAGAWRISVDVRPGENVELQSVGMRVKGNVRSPDMMLLIVAGLIAAFGLALGVLARR